MSTLEVAYKRGKKPISPKRNEGNFKSAISFTHSLLRQVRLILEDNEFKLLAALTPQK